MRNLPLTLTLLSAIPFVGFSVAVSMQVFSDNGFVIRSLLSYSAVILSFMGGIHWGVAVTSYAHDRRVANLLIAESVVPSTLAWAALFHTELHIQLLVLTLLFTFVWAIDSILVGKKILPGWFFEIRCIITPIVVVSLYVAYFGMI
jgi:uncharacterized membrane protein YhdT